MQSTIVTAIRAMVIVAFLTMLPLVAIAGKGLTHWAKVWLGYEADAASSGVLADTIESLTPRHTARGGPPYERLSSAPRFQPTPRNGSAGSPLLSLDESPPPEMQPARLVAESSGTADDRRGGFVYEREVEHASEPAGFFAPPGPPAGEAPPVSNSEVPRASDLAASVMTTPGGQERAVDRFTRMEERLRELGAVHYMLETWGAGGKRYRFQCRMPLGPDSTATRQFTAVGDTAIEAMETILADIEQWSLSKRP